MSTHKIIGQNGPTCSILQCAAVFTVIVSLLGPNIETTAAQTTDRPSLNVVLFKYTSETNRRIEKSSNPFSFVPGEFARKILALNYVSKKIDVERQRLSPAKYAQRQSRPATYVPRRYPGTHYLEMKTTFGPGGGVLLKLTLDEFRRLLDSMPQSDLGPIRWELSVDAKKTTTEVVQAINEWVNKLLDVQIKHEYSRTKRDNWLLAYCIFPPNKSNSANDLEAVAEELTVRYGSALAGLGDKWDYAVKRMNRVEWKYICSQAEGVRQYPGRRRYLHAVSGFVRIDRKAIELYWEIGDDIGKDYDLDIVSGIDETTALSVADKIAVVVVSDMAKALSGGE